MGAEAGLPAAAKVNDGPTRLSVLLAGLALVIVGAVGYFAAIPFNSEAGRALYQRTAAAQQACKAAADAILALRKGQTTSFVDDCAEPTVTQMSNLRGQLIVTRVIDTPCDTAKHQQVTYSVMVDGQGKDRWRILEVKLAPNKITLDASLLLTATPAAARRAEH